MAFTRRIASKNLSMRIDGREPKYRAGAAREQLAIVLEGAE
jgi:hypothetical protein